MTSLLTYQIFHEKSKLLGDDGELLEGRPDVVGLVLPHDGRLAQPVESFCELHLTCDMACKEIILKVIRNFKICSLYILISLIS